MKASDVYKKHLEDLQEVSKDLEELKRCLEKEDKTSYDQCLKKVKKKVRTLTSPTYPDAGPDPIFVSNP